MKHFSRRGTTHLLAKRAVLPTTAVALTSSASLIRRSNHLDCNSSVSCAIAATTAATASARRYQSSGTGADGSDGGSAPTKKAEKVIPDQLPPYIKEVTALNFANTVLKEKGAMLLYFHVKSHPRVVELTKTIMSVVDRYHTEPASASSSSGEGAAVPPGASSGSSGPDGSINKALKSKITLGLVDCEVEADVAQQFQINANAFPLIMFLHNGRPLDRLVGMMTEVQLTDAVNALADYCSKSAGEQDAMARQAAQGAGTETGPAEGALEKEMDSNDENAGTLLALGIHMMREGKTTKARQLFDKGIRLADEKITALKEKHFLHKKKMTPETEAILRKDPNYRAQAHLMMGLALLDHKCGNLDAAFEASQIVREKFPSASKDQQEVANLMAYIELSYLSRFDEKMDDVAKLSMDSKSLDKPCSFYRNALKLAVAHFTNKHFDLCIDELLRLIRAERKIMKDLVEGCVVADSSKIKGLKGTPARQCLGIIFDALGLKNALVVKARKQMAVFM